jgi:phosphomannomutase/phosphoglucomutase
MEWVPVFGTSGIRGEVNQELTPQVAWKIGLGVATVFKRQTMLLCHDNRTSGPLLAHAVASGLMAGGSSVLFGGEVITPAVSLYTRAHQLAGAVLITGSHIPANMSGIEVLASDGAPVDLKTEEQIETQVQRGPAPLPWSQQGSLTIRSDIGQCWIDTVLDQVDLELIREKQFRVVVDAANGTAVPWLLDIIRSLDCTLIGINTRSDPLFPGRSPNLRVKLLEEAAQLVKTTKSDLGIAVDGDGDRAFFIDDKGRALMGDVSGTLLACLELDRQGGGTIVTPINSSNLIEEMVAKHNGTVKYSRVGPPAIVAAVKQHNAVFAFEESGKAIYPQHNFLSDSGLASVYLLEHLAKTESALSALIDQFPKYHQLKRALDCPNHLKQQIIDHVLQSAKNQVPKASVVTIDGIKLVFDDGWLLLRPSGTEPVFRCFSEARSKRRAQELLQLGLNWINDIIASPNAKNE